MLKPARLARGGAATHERHDQAQNGENYADGDENRACVRDWVHLEHEMVDESDNRDNDTNGEKSVATTTHLLAPL